MWNKIISTVAVLAIATASIFGYLYNIEKSKNVELSIENGKYKRNYEFIDSMYAISQNANEELAKDNEAYKKENAELNSKLEKVEEELKNKEEWLSNQPIDTVAKFIVDQLAGDKYKVQKIDDNTFVLFQEITTRDMANTIIQYLAEIERNKLLKGKISARDTLLKKQAKNILILQNTIDSTLSRYNTLNEDYKDSLNKIIDLTTEVDKQKGLKRIGFITSGGLLLTLLIVL